MVEAEAQREAREAPRPLRVRGVGRRAAEARERLDGVRVAEQREGRRAAAVEPGAYDGYLSKERRVS